MIKKRGRLDARQRPILPLRVECVRCEKTFGLGFVVYRGTSPIIKRPPPLRPSQDPKHWPTAGSSGGVFLISEVPL